MKTLKKILMAGAFALSVPATAQDFGFPQDKAFYKAHWNEVMQDLGPDRYLFNAQYVLYDFDRDGRAELYLQITPSNEYVYTIKNNKVVRVGETNSEELNDFTLNEFYTPFTAPYELLLDKPVNKEMATEQHLYDMFDVPGIWFKLQPEVEGTFNIKSAAGALYCFDCNSLGDALYAIENGNNNKEFVEEYVVDVKNGYAKVKYKTDTMNMVELCYWNMTNGEKLLCLHYHLSEEYGGEVHWCEQLLFMKYNPKTKRMTPVVAPLQGYDFRTEYNFELPRVGKNLKLYGVEDEEMKWTGSGFKF